MAEIGHNRQSIVLDLTREEAAFMLHNAEENMRQGLMLLNGDFSEEAKRKVVDLIENFRPIRDKLREQL